MDQQEPNGCGCRACGGPEAAAEHRLRRSLEARKTYFGHEAPDARNREEPLEVGWRLADVWVAEVHVGVPVDGPTARGFAVRVVRDVVDEFPDRLILSSRGAWAEFEAGQTPVIGDDAYGLRD